MTYKYIQAQIEGAKELAEKHPHIQSHKDIYNEHVEVLEKAQAFDELLDIYKVCIEENGLEDELLDDLSEVLDRYIYDWEDTENENQ